MDPGHAILCCVSLYDGHKYFACLFCRTIVLGTRNEAGENVRIREDQTKWLLGAGTKMNACMVYIGEHGSCNCVGKATRFALRTSEVASSFLDIQYGREAS